LNLYVVGDDVFLIENFSQRTIVIISVKGVLVVGLIAREECHLHMLDDVVLNQFQATAVIQIDTADTITTTELGTYDIVNVIVVNNLRRIYDIQ
jgi:hypothetical protein